ncbi:MAG: alpha/beta hydrolase [Acetobacteraceae bacterium]|nr:alpha/beta hydrolase [Acetobacteraceae bacterium]MSP29820.1 alpha/beta hydrolase [Acetobacteraceae bacterium]
MPTIQWTSNTITVAGTELHVQRGGTGTPILLLHRDIGTLESLPFYDALAQRHDVIIPHHPGYGKSPRPEWVGSTRDIATLHRALLGQLGVKDATLVGLGFGGWIGAEMATYAPYDTSKIVLLNPMGVKPPNGDILDQALISYIEYVQAGFHDAAVFDRIFGARPSSEQLIAWDICREMSFRVAWRPYMYNDSLPHLLRGVQAKALILASEHDQVVPRSAATLYAAQLPNARLQIVANAGHLAELEQPAALADIITSFIAA